MSENSLRKHINGKIIQTVNSNSNSSRIHPNMENGRNNTLNVDSDSNSSENYQYDQKTTSQRKMNQRMSKLQNEMSEIKTLLPALTQQVIPRLGEGTASRASSSRTQKSIDNNLEIFAHFLRFLQIE